MRSLGRDRLASPDGVSPGDINVAGSRHVLTDFVLQSTTDVGTPSSQRMNAVFTETKTELEIKWSVIFTVVT